MRSGRSGKAAGALTELTELHKKGQIWCNRSGPGLRNYSNANRKRRIQATETESEKSSFTGHMRH